MPVKIEKGNKYMNIDKTKPVMITGVTGYVGGHVARKFLEEGLSVHAPIRNPSDANATQYLNEIASRSEGSITYFKADLLMPGSYDEAMRGCQVVIHTASPFISNPKNAQKDLVDPALKGTENVMRSVQKQESVKRVVLTSSCAAIYGDAKDLLTYTNETMTEKNWNTTSSLKQAPYNYSKTVAEKKAWEMTALQSRFDLVVINPSFVLGPGINPNGTSESFNIVKQMGDGTLKMGGPDINIGCVDVRDVAEAHYRAAIMPAASGRNICSAENLSFMELADMLRPKYGAKYPLPKKTIPKWLMTLVGPLVGISRQFLKDNVGYPWKADNTKIKRDLKMEFRPISTAINEFFEQIESVQGFTKK